MTLVNFTDISRSFSGVHIFGPATGIIREGDRIGVVGPNGSGKTTFCRVLAGLDRPDEGQVHRDKKLRQHYMEQEPVLDSGFGVLEELMRSCTELRELESSIHAFAGRLDSGEKPEARELERYGTMLERFERLGGYSLESRAAKILTGLGLGPETFKQSVNSLSGGQRSRISLAKALIGEPDLLFLDEPTNHLDLRAIEYLENFLLETSSTVVVISHDRAFLDKLTSRIIEILDGTVTQRPGNYSAFSEWAREEAERLSREHQNYERKVEQIEEFIRRNIYGQKTRQAQSRRKMLARMKPPPKARRQTDAPSWEIGITRRSGSLVLECRSVKYAWPDREPLFENLDLTLMRGETLAIIGDNGSGKTTLLELLAGRLLPKAGEITWGKEVQTELLPQRVERPSEGSRVIDYMAARAPGLTLGQLRSLLARYLFSGEDVEKSVDALSEGEFRRLLLAGIIHSKANLLLLDEPTNHLDIYSREALQSALLDYPGTVVLISHDRQLISALATRILEFGPAGQAAEKKDKVVEYAGDYSYYKLEKEKRAARLEQSAAGPERKPSRPAESGGAESGPAEVGLSKNELRRLKERKNYLENEIAGLEERVHRLQLALADPETYRQEGRAAGLATEIEKLQGEISAAYGEWEELIEYD